MRFLDAARLARLRNLRLDLRRHRAEGALAGRHRSALHGFSQEFAQHREYAPGDELKHLDWKVYGRKDRFFVRQFQEEKSLKAYLLLDSSGSMAYRCSGPVSKWDYARGLAAGTAYVALSQGDAAGLVTFDVKPGVFIPPRRGMNHLELMDRVLADSSPGGETDLASALRAVSGRIPRRSLLVLVSDLLGVPERVLEVVRALKARKHEVLVLQPLDPMERDFAFDGPVEFRSLEDGATLRCEAALLRDAYRLEFEGFLRAYRAGFHRAGVPYAVLTTDAPWEDGLSEFVAGRGASR